MMVTRIASLPKADPSFIGQGWCGENGHVPRCSNQTVIFCGCKKLGLNNSPNLLTSLRKAAKWHTCVSWWMSCFFHQFCNACVENRDRFPWLKVVEPFESNQWRDGTVETVQWADSLSPNSNGMPPNSWKMQPKTGGEIHVSMFTTYTFMHVVLYLQYLYIYIYVSYTYIHCITY